MARSDALFRQIEAMNVVGRERQWAAIPEALARSARPRVIHVADALVTLMKKSDSLRVNRVIGLGHRGEATARAIDEIVAIYRGEGISRFSLEVAPGPQAAALDGWLAARGFERHRGYSVLTRDLDGAIPAPTAGVRIRRANRADLGHAVDIFGEIFATPASRRAWSLKAAENGETTYFLAWVGDHAVGAGALKVDRGLAWLVGGAVRTRWRRHGAHSALITARLRWAKRLGCSRAWSETTAPTPGRPGGSRRNLMRLGFAEIGTKAAYVWQR